MKAVTIAVWCGLAIVLLAVVGAGARGLLRGGVNGGDAIASSRATYLQGGGDFGAVPPFSLTERSGRTVSLHDLAGRFWIADFIFTRCTGSCPILSARMVSLVKSLGPTDADDLRFVTFSVDPEWDTPSVLSRYAAGLGAADPRWFFLTGPQETLYHVIGDGFHLSVASSVPSGTPTGRSSEVASDLITHSDRFVLVDRSGRIRGYYHGSDEETPRTIVADLEKLRLEPSR